jgi:thymidylate kinase
MGMTEKMVRQSHRIIVEGMDGSGKTTLICDLKLRFPELQVVTRPPGVPFNYWWPQELDRTPSEPVPLHDRFFYSELVYGPVLRGRIEPRMELINNMIWFLRSTALLIYARPHSAVLRTAAERNLQMDGVMENFMPLLEAYDRLMAEEMTWYDKRFHRYDWNSNNGYDNVVMAVEDYLK